MYTRSEAPQPTDESLKLIDDAIGRIKPEGDSLDDWFGKYARNHRVRLAFDLDYLREAIKETPQARILEIGSIPPILTAAIKAADMTVTGLDTDPTRFQSAIDSEELDIRQGLLGGGALPFEENSFDVILFNEVFEHLNCNLIDVFEDLMRICAPDARLFLSTPNLRSWVGTKNFLFKKKAYAICGELYDEYAKLKKLGHMGHVREYTPTEVRLFLGKMNFKPESIIFRGQMPKNLNWLGNLKPSLRPFFTLVTRAKKDSQS